MTIKWKYVEKVDKEKIKEIEEYFKIKLPDDYKNALKDCNRGKPDKYRFDTADRNECVLDYMINISDCIDKSKSIKNHQLIPIATDPFGNIIGYKIDRKNGIGSLVFYDHENKDLAFIAKDYNSFLNKLY